MLKHKKLLATLGILIVIGGLVAARLVYLNTDDASENQPIEIVEADQVEDEGSEEESSEETSEEVEAFIDKLTSVVFTDGVSETNYLVFSDSSYNIYLNNTLSAVPYSIDSVQTETLVSDQETVQRTTASITTNTGSYILTADIQDGQDSISVIVCEGFGDTTTWIAAEKTDSVIIGQPNENIADLIDNKTDELYETIKTYCDANKPLAVSAMPSNGAYIDYDNNTVTITYVLSPSTQTPLSVVYDKNEQTFSVTSM